MCQSRRWNDSRCHAKIKFNNCLLHIFEQSAKEDTSLNEHYRDEELEVRDFELDMITQYLLQILGYYVNLTCYYILAVTPDQSEFS